MIFRAKSSFVIFLIISQIFLVTALSIPSQVSAQSQSPTLSINPLTSTVTSSQVTVYVAITQVQNLNAIHFVLSFNDGPMFLNDSNPVVVAGDLFAGKTPNPPTQNSYYLSATSRSYLDVLFELPGTQTVSSTGTKNVAAITFTVLPNATAGMKSGINIDSVEAMLDGNLVDTQSGFMFQPGSVTMGYIATSIVANSAQATVKTAVSLSSTLKDGQGIPLSGLNVDYYVGSQKVGTTATDTNGVSSISYTPSDVGSFTITAQYVGNQAGGKYASCSGTATLTVSAVQPTTNPTNQPTNQPTTNPTTQPTNGPTNQPTNQLTNQPTTSPTDQPTGQPTNQPTTQPSTQPTTAANSQATTLTLNDPVATNAGQQVMLSATLKDSSQKAVAGATIVYSVVSNGNEKTIGTSTTNQNGNAIIPFTPDTKGNYLIKAKFTQTPTYLASSDSTIVSVDLLATNIVVNVSDDGKVGDSTSLAATLKDANQQPISQADIQFQVLENGAWTTLGTAATNSQGDASIQYKLDKAGTLTVRAMYAGTSDYGGSISDEKTLGVTEANSMSNALPYVVVIAAVAIGVSASSALVIRRRKKRN